MKSLEPTPTRLSDYTNLLTESIVVVLSVAPILILAYCYSTLPGRIPLFLNWQGEVEVWASKSFVSVFRVPAMAIDLQLICLLMKFGTVKSLAVSQVRAAEYRPYQRITGVLMARLWDLLRCAVAVKMAAESLSLISEKWTRFHWLVRIIPWLVAIMAIIGVVFYGYRLINVRRQMKKALGPIQVASHLDSTQVVAGIIYFAREDSRMFVDKYLFNFGNIYSYALLACLIAYPLIVFSAAKS